MILSSCDGLYLIKHDGKYYISEYRGSKSSEEMERYIPILPAIPYQYEADRIYTRLVKERMKKYERNFDK